MKLLNDLPKSAGRIYITAAKELGLKYKIYDRARSLYSIFANSKEYFFRNTYTDQNDYVWASVAESKDLNSRYLISKGLPFVKNYAFSLNDIEELLKKFKELQTNEIKVVVKPTSLWGGQGVFVDIKNEKELLMCIQKIENLNVDRFVLEEYVSGKYEYRVLCTKGKVIDVVKKTPAFVIGDGRSTIEQLIDNKNKKRKEADNSSRIIIDDKLESNLKEASLNLGSIPVVEQMVYLRKVSNLSLGGESQRINLKNIHPDNINIFEKIAEESRLNLCGIDFISDDLSIPYYENGAKCIEINECPGLQLHYFAGGDPNLSVAKKVLINLFDLKL